MRIEETAFKRGYRVNKKGDIFNPYGKLIGNKKYSAYRYTKIRIDGKSCRVCIHRLQAFQKYGNKMYEKGIVVRHKI